jgi:DNA helicase-2/ATP-dependent DNA helicase PcrA
VIRRTGLQAEIDAGPDAEVAAARTRNLAAFLDEVHAFAPVEGELTLRAFLDYVDAVEASDKPEWSPVQPSEDNSVKVMTIHQAKGLEFDNVFVPGLAKDLLPSNLLQHNPATRGKSMDFELRGDTDILPKLEDYDGVVKKFWQALKDQELIEERRTCYVALTRARHRLFVSGAHWYGETDRPKRPSTFFDELADWGEASGAAVVDRGPDQTSENPLLGYRERLVREWPGPALRDAPDELFSEGWRKGAASTTASSLVASLPREDRATYDRAVAEQRALVMQIEERERRATAPPWMPASISVSALIDYERCPKLFYWSAIRPLPRFSGPSARMGTEIHRWIEKQSSGQATLVELEEQPDLTTEELIGQPGRMERLKQSFKKSRFGDRVPLFAERPFLLNVEGLVIGGKIDAIYDRPGGGWEVVDYKSGKARDVESPLFWLQLDVYALACVDVWHKPAEDLVVTYLYLDDEREYSRPAGVVAESRRRVAEALRGIASARFGATPSEYCGWCDFLSFCEPGRAFLGSRGSAT